MKMSTVRKIVQTLKVTVEVLFKILLVKMMELVLKRLNRMENYKLGLLLGMLTRVLY